MKIKKLLRQEGPSVCFAVSFVQLKQKVTQSVCYQASPSRDQVVFYEECQLSDNVGSDSCLPPPRWFPSTYSSYFVFSASSGHPLVSERVSDAH